MTTIKQVEEQLRVLETWFETEMDRILHMNSCMANHYEASARQTYATHKALLNARLAATPRNTGGSSSSLPISSADGKTAVELHKIDVV